MTDAAPSIPVNPSMVDRVKLTWNAAPELAAQSNILGPYVLILTAMVGTKVGIPSEMCWQMFGAGLMAWKAGTL